MKRWLIPSAWLIFLAVCLWWTGIFLYDIVSNERSPLGDVWLFDWRRMDIVYRTGPWIAGAFVVLAFWSLASRVILFAKPPTWFVWVIGAAVLGWTSFVLWRAHSQAFQCLLWENTVGWYCWLPDILLSVLWWLLIPPLCWVVVATTRSAWLPGLRTGFSEHGARIRP